MVVARAYFGYRVTTMSDSAKPPAAPSPDRFAKAPAVEIELVHETRVAPAVERPWRMLEVWTLNHVYGIDSGMRCIEVLDAKTRKEVADHALLGARLVGGQFVESDKVTHLSHPFPRPGTEAVFEQTSKGVANFSHSSAVVRVVLRLRHLTLDGATPTPSWDELAPPQSRGR
jgi:hypothetical protein